MKTQSMQQRLTDLYSAGKIKSGETYSLMPSDCRGDGYDIAISPRTDESGDYEVSEHLMRITCIAKVGSRNWSKGIPAGYKLECEPSTPNIAITQGEQAEVIHRIGTHIGNGGYMHRKLASIAIRKPDGKLRYNGHTPYWIKSTATYAAHYLSGLSKSDNANYKTDVEQLEAICNQINSRAA